MADVIQFRADDRLAEQLTAEATRRSTSVSDVVRSGLTRAYALDRPVYGPGSSASFVADAWTALSGSGGDPNAAGRIAQFRRELDDGTALAAFTLHTGNASEVIPPGVAPLVPDPATDRPLWALTTQQTITSPQPFTCPGLATAGTATAAHVELVAPTAGTLAFAGALVNPKGFSGLFDCTRELLDSSNPTVDSVVLGEMIESFNRQLEQLVYTELGTLTASATVAAAALPAEVRKQVGRMVGARRRRAAAAAISAADAIIDAADALPAANSGSAIGFNEATGDSTTPWYVQGVPVNISADLGSASGQVIATVVSPASLWSWSTGPTTFRFEQIQGPGIIRLAIHGYAACKTLRPAGVRTIKLT